MADELIIAPEAQQDVDEAYCWYEDRRYSFPNTPPIIKVDFKTIGVYTKNINDIER